LQTLLRKYFEGLIDDVWELNNNAWMIFVKCKKKKILEKALKWSEMSINLCNNKIEMSQFLDTKANLLYKLGMTKQAVSFEENAFMLSGDFAGYLSTLNKMKIGMPTW